jgi:hypothetical protein
MIPNSIHTRVLNVRKTITEQQEKMDLMFKVLKITTYKLFTLRHINCSHYTDKFTHYGTEAQLKIGQRTFEGQMCRHLHHKHCIK